MKLSILICTVVGREDSFNRIHNKLMEQVTELGFYDDEVEILWERDNKQISVGAKRQKLLERAKGDYIVFVDDDDDVKGDYVRSLYEATKEGSDCIGFEIECHGTEGFSASASLKHGKWAQDCNGFDYVRTPYHKTPVKRDIALKVGFKDMRFGEDYEYSMGLLKYLKTETYIPKVLYIYCYKYENPKIKYGIK